MDVWKIMRLANVLSKENGDRNFEITESYLKKQGLKIFSEVG